LTSEQREVWVALIRGINVGGKGKLAMGDLRRLLESLGYGDVRTHLQSGNAIFTAAPVAANALEAEISSRLESDLGLAVKVLVRGARELTSVIDGNPFVSEGVDPKHLMVSFLSEPAPPARVTAIDPRAYEPDRFEFGSRVIYLMMPNGFIGSKLPNFERLLGIAATTRTWRTVTRLRDLTAG
jgi:uncharacterized protein (DUF1697 family)